MATARISERAYSLFAQPGVQYHTLHYEISLCLTYRRYLRHIVQLAALIVLNGRLLGIAPTGIIVPYLHPTGGPYSVVHGAYDSLEYTISKAVFPVLVLGIIYLTGVLVGKVFCGWACPIGMLQDFLAYLPFKKAHPSPSMHAALKDLKYVLTGVSLAVAVLVGFRRADDPTSTPAGLFSDGHFAVISPASTVFAYLPWLALWQADIITNGGWIVFIKFAALFAFLGPSLYVPRFFCRYFCPMGTLLDPVTSYKVLRIGRSQKSNAVEQNKVLTEVCPMGVQVDNNSAFVDHPGCVHCGRCVSADPKQFRQELAPL